jgi:hypothetical protein
VYPLGTFGTRNTQMFDTNSPPVSATHTFQLRPSAAMHRRRPRTVEVEPRPKPGLTCCYVGGSGHNHRRLRLVNHDQLTKESARVLNRQKQAK